MLNCEYIGKVPEKNNTNCMIWAFVKNVLCYCVFFDMLKQFCRNYVFVVHAESLQLNVFCMLNFPAVVIVWGKIAFFSNDAEYVNCVGKHVQKRYLFDMSNVLKVLNRFQHYFPCFGSQLHVANNAEYHSTYSTLPLKETHVLESVCQHIQHFSRKIKT